MLLAEITKVDRMTLSQSIRSLEHKGLVRRIVAVGNKRAYHVELTETGGKVAARAVKRIIAAHEAFFSSLGDKAGEYVTLTQQLIKANDIMESEHERTA